MKILIVSDYATATGGAEIALFTLRDGLRRHGHEVRFLASTARPDRAPLDADYLCVGTLGRARTLLQTFNPSAMFTLRRALRDFRPDVVHVGLFLTQLSPLILAALDHVPSLFQVHWLRPICPIGTKLRPDRTECTTPAGTICYRAGCVPAADVVPLGCQMALWRHWSTKFSSIVANSEATRQRLTAEGVPVSDVIGIGSPSRSLRPRLTNPPTVAFAGRLVREKGVDVLLRAFARVRRQIPAARLLVAGVGPERAQLDATIAALGIGEGVSLAGQQPPAALERLLAPAWVQAVPSLWQEPFGLVAVEAMMRGTSVVASRVGGLAEIVRDHVSGRLVPPDDEEALAEALTWILSRRETAEALGRTARDIAQRDFSEEAYVQRFIDCYVRLIRAAPNHQSRGRA